MKKVIIICMLIIASVHTFAQSWKTTEFKADELKGTEAYTAFTYNDESGNSFVFWSNTDKAIRIINEEKLFDSNMNGEIWVKVGFYDDTDKLTQKKDMVFKMINGTYSIAETRYKKEAAIILKYLKEEKGYIRFIAPQYQTVATWEIKVPCLNNNKK